MTIITGVRAKKLVELLEAPTKEAEALKERITVLRGEIESLTIERDRKTEDFARREREIDHKVGLERKRQEFETDAAKREAIVSVREENLKQDQARFAAQMEFQNKRFTEEVGYLKDLMKDILERLPNVNVKVKG